MATATAIGTDTLNSVTRRYLSQQITDQIYTSVLLLYRLDRANKKKVQGGLHIEYPLLVSRLGSAGTYTGFDLLDTTPSEIMRNAAWGWATYYANVILDGTTILRNDSAESIANILEAYLEAARMEMEELVGNDIFSDATTNTERIDGLQGAVDNGTVAATYGGLGSRTTTNSFWQPRAGALDTTTPTLTLDAMQTVFQNATDGARHPTIIVTTRPNYNRYWSTAQVHQRFPAEPMGTDEQLAKAGFTNLLFNNVPVAVDPHTNANHIYFLNEEYIDWIVHPARDFAVQDWKEALNQDVMVCSLYFMGQLIVSNIANQGLMTAVAA